MEKAIKNLLTIATMLAFVWMGLATSEPEDPIPEKPLKADVRLVDGKRWVVHNLDTFAWNYLDVSSRVAKPDSTYESYYYALYPSLPLPPQDSIFIAVDSVYKTNGDSLMMSPNGLYLKEGRILEIQVSVEGKDALYIYRKEF